MAVGFQSVTDNGANVQLDSDYSNYVEVARGTRGAGVTYYSGSGDYSNLVFVRPQWNGTKVAAWGAAPGGQPGQGVHPPGEYFDTQQIGGGGIDYAVFSTSNRARGPVAPGSGILVCTANGNTAYYSGFRYLRVVATPQASADGPVVTHYLPSPTPGYRYYVALNNLWLTRTQEWDESGYFAAFANDTTLQIFPNEYSSESSAPDPVDYRPPRWHTPSIMVAEIQI